MSSAVSDGGPPAAVLTAVGVVYGGGVPVRALDGVSLTGGSIGIANVVSRASANAPTRSAS